MMLRTNALQYILEITRRPLQGLCKLSLIHRQDAKHLRKEGKQFIEFLACSPSASHVGSVCHSEERDAECYPSFLSGLQDATGLLHTLAPGNEIEDDIRVDKHFHLPSR